MSKAIEGAAFLAGAVGMGVAAFMDPALIASPLFDKLWATMVIGGISMEAGAIAGALTSNRGMGITTRQTASFRQIIYGEQRIGGVEIYRSTTGSHHDQFNYIIVLAGHECDSIVNLYLDGRQVFWRGSGGTAGYTVRNGVGFGGDADHGDHIGPNGQKYNFGTLVYCQARFGDQLPTDYITAITANDPNWAPSASGIPSVAGCTYVYLKVEYDQAMFPGEPEIRFTVRGKNNILDPRTGTTGYTNNWALVVADVLLDPIFGLGDIGSVNTEQLIAAANVCDESVPLANGNSELRYTCNYRYDTSSAPGDVLQTMMSAAAGKLSRIGGEWFVWPAYWQGPSYSYDENALTGTVEWLPYRSVRDLFNRVNGTYIAPNYPYNDAGNLYDANGWYYGQTQDNFPFAFQPTNYPQYAADVLHGYAADQWLEEDGGVQRPREIAQSCVLSVTQAQRVAKIYLLRNRAQGSGTFPMALSAFLMQPCDVMTFTMAAWGWVDKQLEIEGFSFKVDSQDGVSSVRGEFKVIETSSTIYEWSTTEELTVYDVPSAPSQAPYVPAVPTNVTLISSAATALIGLDGIVRPRIEVTWDTPEDVMASKIEIQFQSIGGLWKDAGTASIVSNDAFIDNVVAGQQYDVRIRSVRYTGAASDWVEIDGFTVSLTLSVLTQDGIGIGSLIAQAFSDGTAQIIANPFTAVIGNATVSVTPTAVNPASLNQGQLYYVYYVDPNFAGGNVSPLATQQSSDFLGKVGYFLIDDIITPATGAGSGTATGSGGTKYSPSAAIDMGSRTTSTPAAAYDGNPTTSASVSGSDSRLGTTNRATSGSCTFKGFPSISPSSVTLYVSASSSCEESSAGNLCTIVAHFGSTSVTLMSSADGAEQQIFSAAVPAGTSLDSVSVSVTAQASSGADDETESSVQIFEIYIQ